jgi:hypothetical protein
MWTVLPSSQRHHHINDACAVLIRNKLQTIVLGSKCFSASCLSCCKPALRDAVNATYLDVLRGRY